MTPRHFEALLLELIDENPFAVRPLLRICRVEFTERVPTLAVTREAQPALLVNLAFVEKHCRTDDEVKAVICHELLHVILGHTEAELTFTPARHLAFDAVINAIIHRTLGPSYSSMMARYYRDEEGLRKLLRPMNDEELSALSSPYMRYMPWSGHRQVPAWVSAWEGLYEGQMVVDDIVEVAQSLERTIALGEGEGEDGPFRLECGDGGMGLDRLLGDHEALEAGGPWPEALEDTLEAGLRQMNGGGIWRQQPRAGVGRNPYEALFVARDSEAIRRWRRATLEVLERHLIPDPRARATDVTPQVFRLPVLSPGDRRAFLRARWSPLIPDASWWSEHRRPSGSAQIYLDVSGSMEAEMPEIVALLHRLSRYLRRPLWAFSDEVAPAVIRDGQLVAQTSGGTSIACVLRHVAKTRPSAAVIVTDGYIEEVPESLVRQAAGTRLHALVSRDGNPAALQRLGIPCTQLAEVPS